MSSTRQTYILAASTLTCQKGSAFILQAKYILLGRADPSNPLLSRVCRVRAWRFGPKEENKGQVLLVHGLSMPSVRPLHAFERPGDASVSLFHIRPKQIVWQPVANALAEAGYEVALFDVNMISPWGRRTFAPYH